MTPVVTFYPRLATRAEHHVERPWIHMQCFGVRVSPMELERIKRQNARFRIGRYFDPVRKAWIKVSPLRLSQ